MEFLGQGSDLSHSCNLHRSCSGAGMDLSHCSRILNPLCHSRNSCLGFLFLLNSVVIHTFLFLFFILSVCFLGLHSRHMEVPRLRVESELQLLAYTTAKVTPDPSCIFSLHHSHSNPRSKLHLQPTPQLTAMLDP